MDDEVVSIYLKLERDPDKTFITKDGTRLYYMDSERSICCLSSGEKSFHDMTMNEFFDFFRDHKF